MGKLESRVLFASFAVTTLDDGVAGSLRDAVDQANATAGADIITFQAGLTGTITLTAGELALTDVAGVDIQGPGSGVIAVSGNDASRVFNIGLDVSAKISGLTLTEGRGSGAGGVLANSGVLELSNSSVSHGRSLTNGNGIANGGTMTITDSVIHDNISPANVGGGIFNGGTLTVLRSVIRNNAGAFGAGISNFGNLTVTASTIRDNQGDGLRQQSQTADTRRMLIRDSAIINNEDAGVFNMVFGDSRVVVLNSTISGNGIGIQTEELGSQPASPIAWTTSVNSTITANGTGVLAVPGAYVELANTIAAGNTVLDVDGSITSIGGNFIGGDPMLGVLGNYGGPTETYQPLAGSPVIDAGNSILARYFGPDGAIGTGDDQPLAFDQRGAGFSRLSGARADAGSFEVQAASASVTTDPAAPAQTALRVQGTGGNDTIAIAAVVGNSSQVDVTANSVYLGRFTFNGRLIIQGSEGDDTITVDPKVSRNMVIFGGAGNDTITSGKGGDVLVGGEGLDRLSSAGGGDILIGGNGADQVIAGSGQDILIGGRTSYDEFSDANVVALSELSDAWRHSILYPLGIIFVGLGIGPSNPYKLNATTVFDDGAQDLLTGGGGLDWFIGNFSGSGVKDVTDRGFLELASDL